MIKIGDRVRCKNTGQIGMVTNIAEVTIPPEEIERARQQGMNLERMPDMVFIETDPEAKRGIVRDPSSIEPVRDH